MTTLELDQAAEKFIRSQGCEPAFKGYRGFPGSICASPNSMVVHGIPGAYKLERGDILSVDIGVVKDGWVADAARTFPVGPVSPIAQKLLAVTEESLQLAVPQCVAGNHLGDIGHAIQQYVEDENGFSIVRTLVGHGIGREMHEDPQIPELRQARHPACCSRRAWCWRSSRWSTSASTRCGMADDHWSIFSADGSLAAHFEFTIAITADGPRILTPWHEATGGRGGRLKPRDDIESIPPAGQSRAYCALLLLSAFAPAAHSFALRATPPR